MAGAALGRSALGAAVAATAHIGLSDAQAQAFLQLLFLQGGIAALLSASAYTRSAHLADREAAVVAGSLRSYGQFVALTTLTLVCLAWIVVPTYGLPRTTHFLLLALMMLGAAGSASNAFLQGLLVGGGAASTAFRPVLVTSLCATVAAGALHDSVGILSLALIWVVPQAGSPLLLLLTSRLARQHVHRSLIASRVGGNYFGLTGGTNATSVGVAFTFRDRWSEIQPVQLAATTFTVVRFTEIAYQLMAMVLSSLPRWTRSLSVLLSGTASRRATFGMLGLVTSCMSVAPALLWSEWTAERLVAAELMAAPGRVVALLTGMMLLSRRSTRAYVAGIASTIAFSATFTWIPFFQHTPYGLQAFQACGTFPIVMCAIVASLTDERDSSSGRKHGSSGPEDATV